MDPPADHLAEIRQARESNEASETVVPTTFVDDAELVWKLTEKFTQDQTAKAMGWNTRVDVARYKALKVLKDAGAWDEIVVPTFQNFGTEVENEDGTAIVPNGTKSVFTEGLLRNILDLGAGQQKLLCKWLVKGKDKKGRAFGSGAPVPRCPPAVPRCRRPVPRCRPALGAVAVKGGPRSCGR